MRDADMHESNDKALAVINECLARLTRLAGGRVSAEWLAYFSSGIPRHALAYALKRFEAPAKPRGRPPKHSKDFWADVMSLLDAEKAQMRAAGIRPTDRGAIKRVIQ
jgi:hypothetical protein